MEFTILSQGQRTKPPSTLFASLSENDQPCPVKAKSRPRHNLSSLKEALDKEGCKSVLLRTKVQGAAPQTHVQTAAGASDTQRAVLGPPDGQEEAVVSLRDRRDEEPAGRVRAVAGESVIRLRVRSEGLPLAGTPRQLPSLHNPQGAGRLRCLQGKGLEHLRRSGSQQQIRLLEGEEDGVVRRGEGTLTPPQRGSTQALQRHRRSAMRAHCRAVWIGLQKRSTETCVSVVHPAESG